MGLFPCNDPLSNKEKNDEDLDNAQQNLENSQNNIINNQSANDFCKRKNIIKKGKKEQKNNYNMDNKNDYNISNNMYLFDENKKSKNKEKKTNYKDCSNINKISNYSPEESTSSKGKKKIYEKKKGIEKNNNNNKLENILMKPDKNKISKIHSENSNKIKKFTDIKDFYLLDNYESIKDKKIYDIKDDEELILIYYYKNKNDFNNDLYKKEDFKEKYEFIYISYEDWKLGFLFPLYKNNINNINSIKIEENDIIKEIKNSSLCQRIEDIFNIKLGSNNEKIMLNKIKTDDNYKNYTLKVEKIKEDQNQSINDDDISKAKISIKYNESDNNFTIKTKKNKNNIIDARKNYQRKEKYSLNNIENNDIIDPISIGKKSTQENNVKENIKKM